ncbi:MAG: calcium/sodium antiporter, partial [Rhodospirillales bacterium]|nr:calcium/sodium antiporter [Rhodospirillales bacterium]
AVALAKKFGVSPLVIGMTVVAIGTSAPELVVGLQAGLSGSPGLALGNVIGSNIANVLLILGAAGLIAPIVSKHGALLGDAVVLMAGSILFAFFCTQGQIGGLAGGVLVLALVVFLYLSYRREHDHGGADAELHVEEVEEIGGLPDGTFVVWLALLGGMAGTIYGADLLVDGGVDIARDYGVSEEVIGLTLIALGTSLPELAASVVAALRGHADVAIGNVVGSNMFNILGISGVVAMVTPLPVSSQIISFDLWVMLGATTIMLPILLWGWRLSRPSAVLFLALYCGYITMQAVGVEQVLASF